MFAFRDFPFVSSLTRFSKKGVIFFPTTFCFSASLTAIWMASSASWHSDSAGMGLQRTSPPCNPWSLLPLVCVSMSAAASAGVSTLDTRSSGWVLLPPQLSPRVKKDGKAFVLYPTTGTPLVSSTSRVLGRSRIDFAPAQTTATLEIENSSRSADTSQLSPRCTPPIPPVTKSRRPAIPANIIVVATVVAPLSPFASTSATSLLDTFLICIPALARCSKSGSFNPM
mmetsp:Transcript_18858/g.47140  ORF Transcript_18858/g.47140 Transcript_18858/m.47140 type:complete len:226 (-) Transcript_18858:268-945(-)